MRSASLPTVWALWAMAFVAPVMGAGKAFAHCDTLDGPVVKAARRALESGNVNFVLIWVPKGDESEIRDAFEKTLDVRKLSPEAKELADMYFFETVVRVHRAGEGEPYMGLKPAGTDLGPAIPTADKALETGSVEPVAKLLAQTAESGVREQFKRVQSKAKFKADDVEAGRAYVAAYVEFVHYVEGIYEAAAKPAQEHSQESQEGARHAEKPHHD